jgi:hypothetical protein
MSVEGPAPYCRTIKQRYNLVGEKCSKCGEFMYPPRDICIEPGCGEVVLWQATPPRVVPEGGFPDGKEDYETWRLEQVLSEAMANNSK